jgi:PBSX family phage terminase large subunit
MKIDFKPSKKQHEAFSKLQLREINTVLYGGSAGGGKTYLGCAWAILSCLQYSQFRFLIARETLKQLRDSTKVTFEEVLRDFGLKNYYHYKWNNHDFTCTFENGSVVLFREVSDLPSDRNFERLGSNPFSYAFLEEAGQITEKAYEVVKSRLRWVLDDYNLTPKILITCNPTKNWLYREFYEPFKNNTLPSDRCFIQAYVDDNPNKKFVSIYKKNLESINDDITRERLLNGNWEYSESDTALCHYDNLIAIFNNPEVFTGNRYITCDIARYGDDDTIIYVWYGLTVKERLVINYDKSNKQALVKTAEFLKNIMYKHNVPVYNVIIDETGVGGGVVDMLPGCVGFISNNKPKNERFMNLKSECAYLLGEKINNNEISFNTDDVDLIDRITSQIMAYKKVNLDTDRKYSITSKADVKKILGGKSPDDADNFIMRMYFELEKPININNIKIVSSLPTFNNDVFNNSFLDYVELERVFNNG